MHPLFALTRFTLLPIVLGTGVLPAYAAPAGATPLLGGIQRESAQQAAIDCDLLPDVSPGPIVVVTAPTPGTTLAAGTLTIQGAALDCAADVGTGVDRVSVFLGGRDAGGLHLGEATLGEPNPIRVAPVDQYSSVGWSLKTAVPLKPGQVNDVYVYARSKQTSVETMVSLPVVGGTGDTAGTASPAPATPTPIPAGPQNEAATSAAGGTQPDTRNVVQPDTPLPNDERSPAMEPAPEPSDVPLAPPDELSAE
jgi:hypothetical protein